MKSELRGLAAKLRLLKPKEKQPFSARVLNTWVEQAQSQLSTTGPRLGWLLAATVVCAILQRVTSDTGPMFLLKGGTMLQYRLGDATRNTRDVDGLVRGDFHEFFTRLDQVLAQPWEPFTFSRSDTEVIDVPARVIKPLRFHIYLAIKGVTWRKIQVEVSPEEGQAGQIAEFIPAPSLTGFGIASPDSIAVLSMSYQIAQKIHAVSDPHDPPRLINDRSRDLIDLLLLRDLVEQSGTPTPEEIARAIRDIFAVRAAEAQETGQVPRAWPAQLVAYPHWETSYATEAADSGLDIPLTQCVAELNHWINQIFTAET